MEITFDTHTLSDWDTQNIRDISVIITDTGCAGHKIAIREGEKIGDSHFTDGKRIFYYEAKYGDVLDESVITHVGAKWILKSSEVHTRCGCGTSFSLRSGDPFQDKLAQVKLAMKQKREGIHST